MNFSTSQVTELRSALSVCKAVGIESVVVADGKIMGANDKRTLAIIAECPIVKAGDPKIGIGRISELSKRIELFDDELVIDAKEGQRGDFVQLTLQRNRTKAQYRCTATSMIPHPKENEDPAQAVIALSKDDATSLVKAIKTFGAETALMKIASSGDVHIECADSTNDQFSTVLPQPASFVNEPSNVLFTYSAANITTVLAVAAADLQNENLELVVGENGSVTLLVKGRTIVLIPNASED
jgi:hypothetical protein